MRSVVKLLALLFILGVAAQTASSKATKQDYGLQIALPEQEQYNTQVVPLRHRRDDEEKPSPAPAPAPIPTPAAEEGGFLSYGKMAGVLVVLAILGGLAFMFRRNLLKMLRGKKQPRYQRVPMEEVSGS
eukprot:comp26246_c0_seq1/m.47084 comp26246_c0_seq1/g.47084  ORF comp26246_c0_seq1/g.47084 comp26246_c0_seq1/m.47084 type:complete len:129 (-) comp26246_c0_seq1:168-554(-)